MPFEIVKNDITQMQVDAIVNAANKSLLGGGGVDGAIHSAAGPELLIECKLLGGCEVGQAKITKGFSLPAKYIIHTVGPIWSGGNQNEQQLLRNCYLNSLKLAEQYSLKSISFPIISSGAFGYPKKQAIQVAITAIKDFLSNSDIYVYLVAYDNETFNACLKI